VRKHVFYSLFDPFQQASNSSESEKYAREWKKAAKDDGKLVSEAAGQTLATT